MTKILKPYTIIPPELYVKRDADRQLLNIIEDMGRPGYVLVSRQMGKTNLLLNAKREAETPNDIFVYIDLSNSYETAKDCFENIVDTIIEVNEDKLKDVTPSIKALRNDIGDIPAHKQHTIELRQIIKAINGKLVIILDEIDALTKTNYSDRIFSQIRSIYFTRVNFPELSRLTYVLSGVIEPTEIIKDPKISPFNIGQKIFLNDFTYNEFEDLIKKAKLSLDQNLVKHIYDWTKGNPRISWDICSSLETIIIEREITSDIIDELIKNVYLTEYDKPPIDNIRELIKNDGELRNAIVEIEYKKSDNISDRIKSKLYLAGITNYTKQTIEIKNEIIRQAISLDWINSIEEEEKGLIGIACEYYHNKDYAKCLSNFQSYLLNYEFPQKVNSLYYYYMGYSAYKLLDFDTSLRYLNQTNFDLEDDAINYYLSQNLKGVVYLNTGKYDLSLEHFKSVLKRNKKDQIFASAIMNIGYISLHSNNTLNIDEAKKTFLDVIEEKNIDSSQIPKDQIKDFKTISYYNLAKLYEKDASNVETKEYYEKALEISSNKKKPKIILDLLPYIEDDQKKESIIDLLWSIIKTLTPNKYDYEQPLDYNVEQLMEVLLIFYVDKKSSFLNLIKENKSNLDSDSIGSIIYDIAYFALGKNKALDIPVKLFHEIYSNRNKPEYEIDSKTFYNTIRLLAYFSDVKSDEKKHKEFLTLFKSEQIVPVDFIDIEIFANYIYFLIEEKEYIEALSYVDIINSEKKNVAKQYLINYLIIHNLELNIHITLANKLKSKETAEQILLMTNNREICKQKSNILGKDGLEIIKSNAESILKPPKDLNTPIKSSRKIGRNEIIKVKYKDGRTMQTKYKKIINDIKTGLCVIVD